jgi:hypothetical protein
MKVKFESDDPIEIKRLAKANDMAYCLWEIANNGWREFKDTDIDYQRVWDVIHDIMVDNNINIEDLVD